MDWEYRWGSCHRGVVNFDKFKGQMRLQGIHHRTCATITGVYHHLHGLKGLGIHIGEQMIHVGGSHIARLNQAFAGRGFKLAGFRKGFNIQ